MDKIDPNGTHHALRQGVAHVAATTAARTGQAWGTVPRHWTQQRAPWWLSLPALAVFAGGLLFFVAACMGHPPA